MELKLKSKSIKKNIDNLIYKKGLNNILQSYGQIFYTGSYYLDVMIWPDLDIEMSLNPDPFSLKAFFEIGEKIADKFKVLSMTFYNRIDFPINEKGLYWNILININENNYNIDLWSFPKDILKQNISNMNNLKKRLTEKNKDKILKIKSLLLNNQGQTPKFSGYNIYQAILNNNLEKKDEILNYLKEKGINI